MKNKITDFRNLMFETIEGLLDEEKPFDIHRAKAVAQVGAVVVESMKAETEYIREMRKNGFELQGTVFFEDVKQIELSVK